MDRIREKLGLDFLKQSSAKSYESSNQTTTALGWRLLSFLNGSQGGNARLFEVVEALQIPIEPLLSTVAQWEDRGAINVTERDLKGNHMIAITDKGREMLNEIRLS